MNQEYFTQFSDMAKKAQEPLKAMAELNVKTLQSMAYLKPDELTAIKKPQDFFEIQLSLALSNGHKALDYMQKSFDIIEKAWLCYAQEIHNKTDVKK